MKYLITLKNDLISAFDPLTADKVTLFLVNGELPRSKLEVTYIARFLFVDCRVENPFTILAYIRTWFEAKGLTIPDLNFDSEIVDLESYDLEIDFSLTDNLVVSDDGTEVHICYPPVWSDELGTFIKGNIAVGDIEGG